VNALDRLGAEGGHGPVAAAAHHLVGEVGKQPRTVRRVHHLGVKLHTVDGLLVVGHGGKGRALTDGDGAKALGQMDHVVAVAHPDLMRLADGP
jgi:hypothetical protein